MAPGQGQYLEVSSCSCFTDYQARRMRLRYKDADGKNQFCHTLNGSGTALPRLYVALLETCQQPGRLHPHSGSARAVLRRGQHPPGTGLNRHFHVPTLNQAHA